MIRKLNTLAVAILLLTTSGMLCAQKLDWAFNLNTLVLSNSFGLYPDDFSVDPSGNAVYVGYLRDTVDFDPDSNQQELIASSQCLDAFIARYNSNGDLSWAYRIDIPSPGSQFNLVIQQVEQDQSGNIYALFEFRGSITFNGTNSSVTVNGPQGRDEALLVKYSPGGQILWTRHIASELDPISFLSMDLTDDGQIYVSGNFVERIYFNYPSKARSTSIYADISRLVENFVAVFDQNGQYVRSRLITGPGIGPSMKMFVDPAKNVHLIGSISDSLFVDTTTAANFFYLPPSGVKNMTFLKMDSMVNFIDDFVVSTRSNLFSGAALVSGSLGMAYLSSFSDTVHLGSAASIAPSSTFDQFIMNLNHDHTLRYAHGYNTAVNSISAAELHFDASDQLYVSGIFTGQQDFDLTADTFIRAAPNGGSNYYLGIYDTNFSAVNVLTFDEPGYGRHSISRIHTDQNLNIFLSGYVGDSADLDPSPDTFLINGTWTWATVPNCSNFGFSNRTEYISKVGYCQSPIVLNGPGPQRVCRGGNAQIFVHAGGDGPFQYQWYKNDTLLTGATSFDLNITNAQYSDSGAYVCIIENACGVLVSDTLNFKVEDCTGIEEKEADMVEIYPNPATDVLFVRSPISFTDYRFLDMSGSIIRSERYLNDRITVGNLESGSYILLLEGPSNLVRKRFVLIR